MPTSAPMTRSLWNWKASTSCSLTRMSCLCLSRTIVCNEGAQEDGEEQSCGNNQVKRIVQFICYYQLDLLDSFREQLTHWHFV